MTPEFAPITREQAAEILAVSPSTLDNMIAAGAMPAPRTLGGRRQYWHPEIFYSWLDRQLRSDATAAEDGQSMPDPSRAAKRPSRKSAAPMGIAERARARNAAKLAALNAERVQD